MKFSTAKEHRDFFQKHGWIEFDDLLSPEQLNTANQEIDQVLAERLNVSVSRLKTFGSEKIYLHGHDVWRSKSFLQKLITQTRFAEIASELIERRPLRLGYDQLFPARMQKPFSDEAAQVYSQFLEQTTSLESVCCLQGVICGFMISLSDQEVELSEEKVSLGGIDIFPSRPGNVIFFQPNVLINWSDLYSHLGQRFYMVVYTQPYANYLLEPKDPHTHSLKRLGYIFNDKLNDALNPIIYR